MGMYVRLSFSLSFRSVGHDMESHVHPLTTRPKGGRLVTVRREPSRADLVTYIRPGEVKRPVRCGK